MVLFSLDPTFTVGKVEVPILGVTVKLAPNEFYRQEFVYDPNERARELYGQLGKSFIPLKDEVAGLSFKLYNVVEGCLLERAYIQLIARALGCKDRQAVIAHENGHFIEFAGQQNLIYRNIGVENQGLKSEAFATLCEFYGLHRAGHDITKVPAIERAPGHLVALSDERNRVKSELEKMLKLRSRAQRSPSLVVALEETQDLEFSHAALLRR